MAAKFGVKPAASSTSIPGSAKVMGPSEATTTRRRPGSTTARLSIRVWAWAW
ncbi:hypothetical protein GALL_553600 [mine drainage metagenome]|uniref:Uncharacterized protein n=1 Tax=mine drainage metagenome TaxID=410659 RepID=A0A1J5NWJ2_9ZZZZ